MPTKRSTSHFRTTCPLFCLSSGAQPGTMGPALRVIALFCLCAFVPPSLTAQTQNNSDEVQQLRELVMNLQSRVVVLEQQNRQLQVGSTPSGSTGPQTAAALASATASLRSADSAPPQQAAAVNPAPANASAALLPGTLPGGATLNYFLDGYYEYNFNNPVGRVNDLRAYDVLSNTFSLNQADFIFDLDPDVAARRRYGFRVDLQFGQATETLQGNPANEPRPDIYRNIFQAYGSYVLPVGHGLQVDMGKWASSLGIEGNYAQRPDELHPFLVLLFPAVLSRGTAYELQAE